MLITYDYHISISLKPVIINILFDPNTVTHIYVVYVYLGYHIHNYMYYVVIAIMLELIILFCGKCN